MFQLSELRSGKKETCGLVAFTLEPLVKTPTSVFSHLFIFKIEATLKT